MASQGQKSNTMYYHEPRDATIDSKFPNAIRWRGSVLRSWRMASKILTMVVVSTIVCLVHYNTSVKLGIPISIISAMGLTVSLLLVFRQVLVLCVWT